MTFWCVLLGSYPTDIQKVKTCKSEKLLRPGKTADIADLPEDHPAINITNARNGHDHRIKIFHDICHLSLNVIDLAIMEFDLLYGMNDLDR